MPNTILIKNAIIVTLGEKNRVLRGYSILCEGGKITKIAKAQNFKGRYAKIVDARGKVAMPGFINSHMHFYSTFARGLGKAKPSKNFVEVLNNLWWRLDKKLTNADSYYSALIPLVDAVRKGTTTIIDHHASPFAVKGSLKAIETAVRETGLRACLCYELSDRDGKEIARAGLEENAGFIRYAAKKNDNFIKAMFGLHASFTLTNATLEEAAEMGLKLGAGFHIHTAESQSDQISCETHHKMRVVERLKEFSILGPKSIAAHCVHVNDAEIDILKETGTAVVHNPQSNANNSVGIADVVKMSARGVLVGLGTDAMTVNMLEEVRNGVWLQHLKHDPSQGFMEPAGALLVNNAKIANRYFTGLGELKEGFAADIILMDYFPPTPLDENNFYGHLVFGLSQSAVDTTIVAGRVLMEGKKLKLDIDEEEVSRKSCELSKKLWSRF
ncbi:MAG: chlorohydrolase [Elusimicrobia bacterium GWC2_51_8]|nr:MAG: chlorohydrolase [Elusimicrobia bacterium GWA2_51_34]OGR58775.1 MAG: chlorohydrolase [Elusimicrobia bacterium GWC2_51_8]OGR86782.1 MAG: chlorohydrolase [Elusimicrobia bacterium GWF2_52_66]HAF94995.1 putative aminohydrolase SsnA [Elusimicrobiota bacterium]HCE99103.1 putative aminohydrolase SsnA [Elusimicrobiota bacterium]